MSTDAVDPVDGRAVSTEGLTSGLLGRRRELALIDAALERFIAGGQPRVVVSGEPGIGKSALLDTLASRAVARGLRVVRGAGDLLGRDEPFGLLHDTFDPALAPFEELLREQLGPARIATLAEALPSLVGAEGDVARAERGPALHRVLAKALEHVAAAEGAVVVVIDDAQWADEESLAVIAQLARRAPQRVLPVLAHRSGAVPDLLTRAIGLASSAGEVVHLGLEPLETEAALRLLGGIAPELARELLHESGGNPFFLTQLAGDARGEEGARANLRAALVGELSALSDDARALVRAAAVLGDPFDPGVAGEVAQLASHQAALQELVAAELVRPTERPDRWIFRRPVVARLVRDWAGDAWCIAAHERAAHALAAVAAPLPEQARHVERWARPGDEEAAGLLARAAAEALDREPLTAARWLGIALRVLGTDGSPAERVNLLLRSAVALDAGGAGDDAARVPLTEAAELLPTVPEDARAAALAPLAQVESVLGRYPETGWLLQQMSPADTAELHLRIAATNLHANDWEAVARSAALALDAGGEGAGSIRVAATALLSVAECQLGDLAAAHEMFAESERAAAAETSLIEHPEALGYLVMAANELDRYATAVAYAEQLLEAGRGSGQDVFVVPALTGLALNCTRLGDLARAESAAREAVEVAAELRDPFSTMFANEYCAIVAIERGEVEDAVAHAELAVQQRSRVPSGVLSELAACALGRAWLAAGDPERAIEVLLSVGGVELRGLAPTLRPSIARAVVEAQLAAGDLAAAREWSERCTAMAAAVGSASAAPTAALSRALVLLEDGDGATAHAAAEQAAAGFEALGRRLDAAHADALLGRALVLEGMRDDGIARLRGAHETLAAAGAGRRREEVAGALRQLGLRVPRGRRALPRPQRGPAALSRREREITALVASGSTNRQIAAELVISEKTVESHLGRIFTKLGVRTRTAAALELARADDEA
ncbi:AAA family ATPase [Conexibacter stalactiti]|uniref:AAA family ATPase n=1 Tax=Conexibacter stalactiti TaxID=1940611 RepID=A0ABU4HYK7_9ACTN|nr:AAA family ATPase [Conexibacter stalactiti]MDW5597560.1 AAA family ATPase [Conexibacter stalactiti]MEC5038202.1 AAA family ATPase [Conexibacter stalactiti]